MFRDDARAEPGSGEPSEAAAARRSGLSPRGQAFRRRLFASSPRANYGRSWLRRIASSRAFLILSRLSGESDQHVWSSRCGCRGGGRGWRCPRLVGRPLSGGRGKCSRVGRDRRSRRNLFRRLRQQRLRARPLQPERAPRPSVRHRRSRRDRPARRVVRTRHRARPRRGRQDHRRRAHGAGRFVVRRRLRARPLPRQGLRRPQRQARHAASGEEGDHESPMRHRHDPPRLLHEREQGPRNLPEARGTHSAPACIAGRAHPQQGEAQSLSGAVGRRRGRCPVRRRTSPARSAATDEELVDEPGAGSYGALAGVRARPKDVCRDLTQRKENLRRRLTGRR